MEGRPQAQEQPRKCRRWQGPGERRACTAAPGRPLVAGAGGCFPPWWASSSLWGLSGCLGFRSCSSWALELGSAAAHGLS